MQSTGQTWSFVIFFFAPSEKQLGKDIITTVHVLNETSKISSSKRMIYPMIFLCYENGLTLCETCIFCNTIVNEGIQ